MSTTTGENKLVRQKKSRNPLAQQALSTNRTQSLYIALIQLLFFIFGLVFMLAGIGRILFEFGGDTVKDLVSAQFNENLLTWQTFIVGVLMILVGYGLWWAMAALGAKEPPAWHAGRNGLLAAIATLVLISLTVAWVESSLLVYVLPVTLVSSSLFLFLLFRLGSEDMRLALGAERLKKVEMRLFTVRNVTIVIGLSTMTVLGVVYAVLADYIELPVPDNEPGELLFLTTFEDYNDEWEIFDDGRRSALVLSDRQLSLSIGPNSNETTVFSLFNRQYTNVDFRAIALHSPDTAVGLVFAYAGPQDYGIFEVHPSGAYRVQYIQDGTAEIISHWQPAVDTFSGEHVIQPDENELRIYRKDEQFWFFLNNTHLRICPQSEDADQLDANCAVPPQDFYPNDTIERSQFGLWAAPENGESGVIEAAFEQVVIYNPPINAISPTFDTDPGIEIYYTTFDQEAVNEEWNQFEEDGIAAHIQTISDNPRLVVTVDKAADHTDAPFSWLNRKFRDFDLRVTVTELRGPSSHDDRFGIIFRQRDVENFENYYTFEISGDGYYRLTKASSEKGVEVISTWIPTTDDESDETPHPTIIRPGQQDYADPTDPFNESTYVPADEELVNEIRIIAKGDRFWFYVNGYHLKLCQRGDNKRSTYNSYTNECVSDELTDFYQDDEFWQGYIGFFVGYTSEGYDEYPTVSVAFDNVLVLGPPDEPPISPSFPPEPAADPKE
jgi:hypothetical protein